MTTFAASVEQWRALVQDVSPTVPSDILLAIIARESGGEVGKAAKRQTGVSYTHKEMACGLAAKYSRRALGLMQVIPKTLREYNTKNPTNRVTPCELVGTSMNDARQQIKAGSWAYRQALQVAKNLSPTKCPWPGANPSVEQVLIANLAYTRGAGAVRDKLADCQKRGLPRTYQSIKQIDPAWGEPEHPFSYSEAVVAAYDPNAIEKKNA